MKETELAKSVIAWLSDQHWDIYQEVQFTAGSSIADIVAVKHGIMWIIECKMSYGFTVLQQASQWLAHYRSVAVPSETYHHHRDYSVAKYYYRVGILEVNTKHDDVWEIIKPPIMYRENDLIKKYRARLTELHKTFAPAGSRGGQHLTPYKETMMDVRKAIEINPGCTIKDLYQSLGKMHYSSADSFKGNLIKALNDFEPWCKVDMSTKPYKLYIADGNGN